MTTSFKLLATLAIALSLTAPAPAAQILTSQSTGNQIKLIRTYKEDGSRLGAIFIDGRTTTTYAGKPGVSGSTKTVKVGNKTTTYTYVAGRGYVKTRPASRR